MEAAVVTQTNVGAAANQDKDQSHSDVKLFNRWVFDDIQISDMSVTDYLAVNPVKHATYVPHTAGRYSVKRFRKAQCPIVERLTNSLMMHGRNNGKKLMAVRIVKHAMEIIHLLTDLNPIQIIVDAVINSGPREDATRIGSAGVVRRQAVDISPLRRVNQAIYLLTTGARESAFRNIKTIAECLADELINAAKGSSNSYAIKKKDEIERVTKANSRAKQTFYTTEYPAHSSLYLFLLLFLFFIYSLYLSNPCASPSIPTRLLNNFHSPHVVNNFPKQPSTTSPRVQKTPLFFSINYSSLPQIPPLVNPTHHSHTHRLERESPLNFLFLFFYYFTLSFENPLNSIRYQNEVEVELPVFKAIQQFRTG
ncbi:40S ribosomal protein S5-like [Camellia sinensis]|uniref:40S ribosomal protein S5-like n=1 Tax=Camellia sinensis TaxID=4442 RepID=UPI001036016A|nr:40S ribosomal protein S5-like [Camellia sinensis]